MKSTSKIQDETDWYIKDSRTQSVLDTLILSVVAETNVMYNTTVEDVMGHQLGFLFVSKLSITPISSSALDRIKPIVERKSKQTTSDILEANGLSSVEYKDTNHRRIDQLEVTEQRFSSTASVNNSTYNMECVVYIFNDSEKYHIIGICRPKQSEISNNMMNYDKIYGTDILDDIVRD